MNPNPGQTPQQVSAQQPRPQGQPGAQAQPRIPMYQPAHIRNLPTLTADEKDKYEKGLQALWNKVNSTDPDTPDHIQARSKIIEFSKILTGKIHQRRHQMTQQPGQQGQQPQARQAPQAQAAQPQQAQQQQQKPPTPQTPVHPPVQPQAQAQQQAAASASTTAPTLAQNPSQLGQQAQAGVKPQTQSQSQNAPAGAATEGMAAQAQAGQAAAAQAAQAAQKMKIPDHVREHVNKIVFRAPLQYADKSPEQVAAWIEDIKEKYGRALTTMESSKKLATDLEKYYNDRQQAGTPLKDKELQNYQLRKEQQTKAYNGALKWVEGVRKQQAMLAQSQANQNSQASAAAAPAAGTGTPAQRVNNANAQPAANNAQSGGNAQANSQNTPAVNPSLEAVKNQQAAAAAAAAAARQTPTNGTPTPTQPRPMPSTIQPTAPAPPQQAQAQPARPEQPQPPPVNTAFSGIANQAQSAGTPTQGAARVQTPQVSTPVTAGGPTRALSHSAAMSLANQRAATTPGSAPVPGQPGTTGTASPAPGAGVNQSVMGSGAQHQQGHPHAHPQQPQQAIQSKLPIPKVLPEKVTQVPQGVTMGGGVNTGRPTVSQGSGTLGGVMNQPAVAKIPAYNHEADGDHVLSKKKLDELVRQVCGGTGEGQEGNMLTPEVEENVLNLADSFLDNVLHAACRNAKERGSKVLEIRDIQLVLERAYNIRIPGYSSDELRTVRKILPSAGWIAKMSAVQAAKVMPGKGE
ncbi:transcription initiation factor TFIID subunit A-domain-containing protein [Stachybotrys elegans]|uniref:Transcription initiation factor TFIID subunit A-domain-containing protein n=1 Tax=Stachybotrys elegans TaxID=80388 RepID=A0A8K0STV3_9HYPO|nr:transcription initiation factor TFIID subunit A-domain-containing protein [Stachybotrys elegans]